MADTSPSAATPAASASSSRFRQPKPKADSPKTPASQDDSQAESKRKKPKIKTDSEKESPVLGEVAPTKSKRSSSRKDKKDSGAKVRSKVVIRRLPPNVPEEVFWSSVAPWIKDAAQVKAFKEAAGQDANALTPTVDYKAFVPGKLKADPNKQNVQSRAYVRFIEPVMVVEFHKNYDGHVFRDSKGNESIAIVEFAPYQKVPTERRRKADVRQGSIEEDESFKAFLQRLEDKSGEQTESKSDAELMAHLSQADKDQLAAAKKSTPLLDHLRATKAARAESAAMSAAKSYKNPYSYQYPDDKGKGKVKSKAEKAARKALAKEAKAEKQPAVSGRAFNVAFSGALGANTPNGKGKEKASEKETEDSVKKSGRRKGGGNKSDATSGAEVKKEKKTVLPTQGQPAPSKLSILKRDTDGEVPKEPAAEAKKKSESRRSRSKGGGAKASGASAQSRPSE